VRTRPSGGDALALVLPLAVGFIGTVPTARAIPTWYRTLDKPQWNPPDAAFGPVWTTLYLLMGIALVVVRRAGEDTRRAQLVFGLQLALNTAWSFVFFGNRDPRGALAVIVLLWSAILATIVGYCLVGIIILVLFHAVVGTILWLFRTVVIIVVILGLLTLYFRLKSPD